MPRGYPNPKPLATEPPRKKRSFFSSVKPLLGIVRPPSPTRAISSDRVLAALQTDSAAVIAAKNFVKDKMGDDKYDVVAKTPVARNLVPAVNGLPPRLTKNGKRIGRPPKVLRNFPSAVAPTKRIALGKGKPAVTIAQRLKEKKAVVVPRKTTLRSHTTPRATESTPAPSAIVTAPPPPPAAKLPVTKPPVVKPPPTPKVKLSLTLTSKATASAAESSKEASAPEIKEVNPAKKKQYMEMGFYCNDDNPPEEAQLHERVLYHKGYRKPGRPRKSIMSLPPIPTPNGEEPSFPPLPLDHGYEQFFGKEQEFILPHYIIWERESGALDGKKRPPSFGKLRTNQFLERSKRVGEGSVACRCDPSSNCGDNCMNRIMSYLCGKDCPCGDRCSNKSLTRRKPKAYKVAWTGPRGFGVFAGENIAEGDFVMDYRGEIIGIDTFIERIDVEYKGGRNFYALHYDGDEVIDAGLRGNDARFINHGCDPNLEVRKYQTVGDGYEEYEVGFWATRDIKAGEELLYDYNFESFSLGGLTSDELRTRCQCGAPNCIGFLSRRSGEKSAKELAKELGVKAAEEARKAEARARRAGTVEARSKRAGTETVETRKRAGTVELRSQRAATDLASVPALPAKRPVGRPRKDSTLMPPPPLPPSAKATKTAAAPNSTRSMPPPPPPTVLADVPVKRGPGRPRKHPLPDPNMPKRGPGRPRKYPLPLPDTPKRGPGRPRKYPLPDAVVKTEPQDPSHGPIRAGTSQERPSPYPVKRGPGRPRKHPLPSPSPGKRGPGRPRKIPPPEDEVLPVLGPRITAKQAEKAKRNGAPAGWAYVPIGPLPGTPEAAPAPEPEAPPSARAQRAARLASVRLGSVAP